MKYLGQFSGYSDQSAVQKRCDSLSRDNLVGTIQIVSIHTDYGNISWTNLHPADIQINLLFSFLFSLIQCIQAQIVYLFSQVNLTITFSFKL